MTWVRLDDAAPEHPKVVDLDDEAFAMWVRALCYCARAGSDGLIPKGSLRRLTPARKPDDVASRLVDAGLWEHADLGAFRVHDFLDYNPAAASVQAKRAARAAAGRAGGIRSGQVRSKDEATGEAIASGIASTKSNPVPSPPDPGSDPPNPPAGGGGRSKPRRDPKPDPLREAFAAGIRDGAPGEAYIPPTGKLGGTLGPVLQTFAAGLDGPEAYAWLRATAARWRRTAAPEYAGGWSPRAFVTALNRDPKLAEAEASPPPASPGHLYVPPPEVDPAEAAANRRAAAESRDLFSRIGLGGAS